MLLVILVSAAAQSSNQHLSGEKSVTRDATEGRVYIVKTHTRTWLPEQGIPQTHRKNRVDAIFKSRSDH